jgi:flavin reductase (DIM6/NTAB) family NADH-FMN oxidoreductase RutF
MTTEDRFHVARTLLAELPCPVVIIGAANEGDRSCATGTAMYVSFAPPAFVIAVHPGSRTSRLVGASGEFSISLLSDGDAEVAVTGGRSAAGGDKLEELGLGIAWSERSQAPALESVSMNAWCRVVQRHEAGDHVLFVGEVVDFRVREGSRLPALIRQRRRYAAVGDWLTDELDSGYPT